MGLAVRRPAAGPAWSARFFSGAAVKDLYRFFACGLLVVIGCLLPWGPAVELVVNDPLAIAEGGPELIEVVQMPPPTAGFELPLGALSLVIGLWLVFSSAYGIYTNRQKILPVFLMIEPAFVSWSITLDAWDMVESTSTLDQIEELFLVAGTGVMLTLVGSTYVALNFLMVVVKVSPRRTTRRRAAAARVARRRPTRRARARRTRRRRRTRTRATRPRPEPTASRTTPRARDAVAAAERVLRDAAQRLRPRAGGAARLEAELLLAHVLEVGRGRLLTLDEVSESVGRRFAALVDERVATGRPLAYLTGRREFHGLELVVDERVLVPRPESELLVDAVLALDDGGQLPPGPIVDRGTGSACLALALARRRPVLAVERSARALEVAAVNRAAQRLAHPVQLVQADGCGCVRPGGAAAVVANPPYVSPDEYAALDDDVRRHEPRAALVPDDGDVLAEYGRVAGEAWDALAPGGWLVAEVGGARAREVAPALAARGYRETGCEPDLAGLPRVVRGRRPA